MIQEVSFAREILTAWNLILPVATAGVIHMFAVKKDWLKDLKIPVARKLFGENKTWRGFVLMPLLSALTTLGCAGFFPFSLMEPVEILGIGWISGLAYVLAELPNSALKRKLGIAPGKLPEGSSWRQKLPFLILDQADSAIGCAIAYGWMIPELSALSLVLCASLAPVIHLSVNLLLFAGGLRKNPF